jgi:hypothetical protein
MHVCAGISNAMPARQKDGKPADKTDFIFLVANDLHYHSKEAIFWAVEIS